MFDGVCQCDMSECIDPPCYIVSTGLICRNVHASDLLTADLLLSSLTLPFKFAKCCDGGNPSD